MTGTNIITYDCRQMTAKAGPHIMGILGMDVLEHYCIQLDFKRGKMRFLDDELADKKGWGKPFPLTDVGNGCFSIGDNLTGAKGSGSLIDTGADYDGWLMPDLFQQWTNRAKPAMDGEVRSPSGVLGGESYPEIHLDRLNEKSLLPDETNIHYNGIGLRFLARHLVTLDFPKRTLYLKRTSAGPLIDKDIQAAAKTVGRFLDSLKKRGQLPGWSKKDKFANRKETVDMQYPNSAVFNHVLKKGDSAIYHYEFDRASKSSPWTLQKAWRTDQDGHIIETYSVP